MGNTWRGISNEKQVQAEVNLLTRGGLKHEDYFFRDVILDENLEANNNGEYRTENFIHSIEIRLHSNPQDQKLPIMVLVHGYGAGGAVFFRILKDLSLHFHLYVVDLLGMGCSGRPKYTAFTPELAENFFVNSLKLWKEKIGINEKFYLAGHSLGGYISTVYALRHPEDIEKLLLLSPVGIPEKPDTFSHEEVVQRFDSKKDKIGAKVILMLWEKNFTPFEVLRVGGSGTTSMFLKFYMNRRMKSIVDEDELKDMKNYLHQIFLRPGSGEYALNTILSPGSWAKRPLFERMQALQMNVSFFYGEKDWMDPLPAMMLRDNGLLPGCIIYRIDHADHHLYLDNPTDTVYKIVFDVFGEEKAKEYLQNKQITVEEKPKQPPNVSEVDQQTIT